MNAAPTSPVEPPCDLDPHFCKSMDAAPVMIWVTDSERRCIWFNRPGRELARRALAMRPGLKVLFMTGYSRNAIVHQGRLDPGVELIQKPLTQGQLTLRIRALLDRDPTTQQL